METVPPAPEPAWHEYVTSFFILLAYASSRLVLPGMLLIGLAVAVSTCNIVCLARQDRAALDMRALVAALNLDRTGTGHYPATEDGLRGLVRRQALERLPLDPWGNEFHYMLWMGCPVIWTYGADATPGGEGQDADLCNMGAPPPPRILERGAQSPPLPPPRFCPGMLEPHS
jgi:general secretion pathway protein G